MAHAEVTVDIHRPPHDVLAYIGDLRRLPDWSSLVLDVRDVQQPGPGQEGSAVSVSKFLGRRFEVPLRLRVQPDPLVMHLESTGGPIANTWRYELTPHASGTRLRIVHDSEPSSFFRVAAPVIDPIILRSMQADVLAIKDLLDHRLDEAQTPA